MDVFRELKVDRVAYSEQKRNSLELKGQNEKVQDMNEMQPAMT